MFRILTLLALALTLITIGLGTYVRTADAGLGCPQWPGCFARPVTELEGAKAAELADGRAADVAKIGIDITTHRYFAGAVGAVILILSARVWALKTNRLQATFLILASLSMVIMQALLGLWTLQHNLPPVAVAGHLIMGFAILLLLYLLFLAVGPDRSRPPPAHARTRILAWLSVLAVVIQLASGAWVSAHYAGLACPDFPACLGQAWPDFDFRGGFAASRGLGGEAAPDSMAQPARVAIHWVHRLGGFAAYLVLTALAILLASCQKSAHLRNAGVGLGALALIETGLGIATILLRLPIVIEVAHAICAGLLLLIAVHVLMLTRGMRVALSAQESL